MTIGRARCLIILEWELRMDRIVRTSPHNSGSTPLSRSRVPREVDFYHNPWATCRSSMGVPGIHQIRAGEKGIPDDDPCFSEPFNLKSIIRRDKSFESKRTPLGLQVFCLAVILYNDRNPVERAKFFCFFKFLIQFVSPL